MSAQYKSLAAQDRRQLRQAQSDFGFGNRRKTKQQTGRRLTGRTGPGVGVVRQRPQFDAALEPLARHRFFIVVLAKIGAHLEAAVRRAASQHIIEFTLYAAQQGVAPAGVDFARAFDVAAEMALGDKIGQHHLRHDRRVAVDHGLGLHQRGRQAGRRHQVTEPQAGEQHF